MSFIGGSTIPHNNIHCATWHTWCVLHYGYYYQKVIINVILGTGKELVHLLSSEEW